MSDFVQKGFDDRTPQIVLKLTIFFQIQDKRKEKKDLALLPAKSVKVRHLL